MRQPWEDRLIATLQTRYAGQQASYALDLFQEPGFVRGLVVVAGRQLRFVVGADSDPVWLVPLDPN